MQVYHLGVTLSNLHYVTDIHDSAIAQVTPPTASWPESRACSLPSWTSYVWHLESHQVHPDL